MNFPFEVKQDSAAVAARRISRCGKNPFGAFEARFDFLTARLASLRHAATPRESAWAANSRPPSFASKHQTCGSSTARLQLSRVILIRIFAGSK